MIPNNVLRLLGGLDASANEMLRSIQSPNELAQYLLNSGRVSQSQVNQAKQMWENPNIRQQISKMI